MNSFCPTLLCVTGRMPHAVMGARLTGIVLGFVFIITCMGGALQAQSVNPQRMFDEANSELESGNINQALQMYRSIEDAGQQSGALFLNMGIGYTNIDSMGMAKYYFMKARMFDETADRAGNALKYVETRFSHQSAVLPELPWQTAINWLAQDIGVVVLLIIGLILFNLGIVAYIAGWFRPGAASKPATYTAYGVIGCGIIILGLSVFTHYQQQRYAKGVMIADEARITEQPTPEAPLVNEAYEGYTFTVDRAKSREYPNWRYVRMSNGLYGWVPAKEIRLL